jgi:DNA invertase Pin-like site-specific DNA recombinase
MKGDSQRRQLEAARSYALEKGLELDEELTFHDLGVSAFKGANATTGKLAAFRRALEDGLVESGSYLLVEDFDRLSRMGPWEALPIFQVIINAGITVVTLKDREVWTRAALRDNPMLIMKSLFAMWNGYQESAKKSGRVAEAWAAKRKRLISGEPLSKPFTRIAPAWLTWNDEAKAFAALPDRAVIVQRIFAMADAGSGVEGIARRLNEEHVPTWGEGKRKSAFWRGSYIRKILASKASIGVFTPHETGSDENTGARRDRPLKPIPNYYPAVVEQDLFERVSGRLGTIAPRGRNADRSPTSVVAGVAKCAQCGSTMVRISKGKAPKAKYTYLVCSKANARATGCERLAIRYVSVEEALRANAAAIVENAPRGPDTTELESQIAAQSETVDSLHDELRFLVDELVKSKSKAVRQVLTQKERQLEEANDKLKAMRELRDATASGHVVKRLQTLQETLGRNPFSISDANSALKQTVRSIVLDAKAGSLTIHWHHSKTPTEDIPFWSRHARLEEE